MRRTKKTRKRTKRTTGSKPQPGSAAAFGPDSSWTRQAVRFAVLVVVSIAIGAAWSAEKPRKPQEPYALIAGTVFRDPGLALPGAELTLAPDPTSKPASKFKKQKALSDGRGEFALRVPAAPMRYHLHVEARGYESETKDIAIQGEERVDVSFRLAPTSKHQGLRLPGGASMKKSLILLGLFLTILAAPAAFAQKKGQDANVRSVEGVVRDASDAVVDGAVVQLKNTKTLQVRSFITQKDGTYHFHGLSTNVDYELKADYQGASSGTKTLTSFDSRPQAVINLKLEPKK